MTSKIVCSGVADVSSDEDDLRANLDRKITEGYELTWNSVPLVHFYSCFLPVSILAEKWAQLMGVGVRGLSPKTVQLILDRRKPLKLRHCLIDF